MPDIHKEIERDVVNTAKILKPHLQTQPVIDASTGKKHDTKRIIWDVVMDGTEKTFTFSEKFAFTNPDSVIVTASAKTTVVIYGEMVGNNKFKIVAASSLSNVKVKVLMRGY